MISLTNHDFQWGRSEVVIIYPESIYQWSDLAMGFTKGIERLGFNRKNWTYHLWISTYVYIIDNAWDLTHDFKGFSVWPTLGFEAVKKNGFKPIGKQHRVVD